MALENYKDFCPQELDSIKHSKALFGFIPVQTKARIPVTVPNSVKKNFEENLESLYYLEYLKSKLEQTQNYFYKNGYKDIHSILRKILLKDYDKRYLIDLGYKETYPILSNYLINEVKKQFLINKANEMFENKFLEISEEIKIEESKIQNEIIEDTEQNDFEDFGFKNDKSPERVKEVANNYEDSSKIDEYRFDCVYNIALAKATVAVAMNYKNDFISLGKKKEFDKLVRDCKNLQEHWKNIDISINNKFGNTISPNLKGTDIEEISSIASNTVKSLRDSFDTVSERLCSKEHSFWSRRN